MDKSCSNQNHSPNPLGRFLWEVLLSLFFGGCGIEDYLFLDRVPSGAISVTLNQRAVITLPFIDSVNFTHFTLYYRIYVSGTYYPEINTGNMRELNTLLESDYSYFLPYTNTDTTSAVSATTFSNRKYYPLALEGADINSVLGSGAFEKTITLDFIESTPRITPNLTVDGRVYNLQRSAGSGVFSPKPANRYFINTDDLNNPANISNATTVSTINADVIDKADITGTRYTYAALYIIVTGIDNYFSPLYSIPTFIGVFYLPSP